MATRFLTSIDLEKHHINHIWPRFSLDVLETEKSNLDSINNALSPAEEAKKIREGKFEYQIYSRTVQGVIFPGSECVFRRPFCPSDILILMINCILFQ